MQTHNLVIILVTIAVYLGMMVYIGVRTSRKNKSTDDFYLGGRKLGPVVTAMSAEASDMSSWLLMGMPGLALLLANGFAEAFWTAVGLGIGTYINWLITAKRIRKYTETTQSSTVPDFFGKRYRDKKGFLEAISAIIIIIFFVPYTASGFAAVGKLFNSLFGVNYHVAMLVGAAVIVVYTVLGGFLAASVTDLVQSIFMTVGLLIMVLFGLVMAGGESAVIQNALDFSADAFRLTGANGEFDVLAIISTLAWGLGYFGMPHILLRFMAIEDDKKLKISRRIASVWVVIAMGIAIFIGILGFSYAKNEGLLGTEGFDPERIIIYMSNAFASYGCFPSLVAGIILSGILASTMSTADSQMLAAASSASENIFHRFFFKDMSEKAQMWVARLTVVAIAVVGVLFALDSNSSVFRIVSFAWAGFGAAFGPLVLFSLFWRRTNKWGALAGMLAGGGMVFVWKYALKPLGGVFGIYELLPAFLVASVAIVVVSLLTPAPEKEITDEFDAVKSALKA